MKLSSFPFGAAIPDCTHAVSTSMPAWQDVVDYEEGNARAKEHVSIGYPRFVYHPLVLELCEKVKAQAGAGGCMVFPSREVATQCANYVVAHGGKPTRELALEGCELAAVLFAETDVTLVREFWMHSGLITSSRRAENYLQQKPANAEGDTAKAALKRQIGELTGQPDNHVFLYPSGMGAVFCAHAALVKLKPGKKTVQLGFPYVDTLKIQQKFGAGCHYLQYDTPDDLKHLEHLLAAEEIAGVFVEYPSNPLLRVVDLAALSAACQRHDVPLVIDDTIATFANVDLSPYADLIVSSLTKYFSGACDVIAGSLVVSKKSGHAASLLQTLTGLYDDLFYADDAVVLAANAKDFVTRMEAINHNTHELATFLQAHPRVAEVYHPAISAKDIYSRYMKRPDGFGGLLSFTLKDETSMPAVYDRLELAKGPSLGTNFTLVCPYTLLAHYHELDFARASGVSPYLLRVSPGLEPIEQLTDIFAKALEN